MKRKVLQKNEKGLQRIYCIEMALISREIVVFFNQIRAVIHKITVLKCFFVSDETGSDSAGLTCLTVTCCNKFYKTE